MKFSKSKITLPNINKV